MTYSVKIENKARKAIKKLPEEISARIIEKLKKIAESPHSFLEKIKSEEGYKVRVGDYRIIVDLDKGKREIHVLAVRHRKNAYKR